MNKIINFWQAEFRKHIFIFIFLLLDCISIIERMSASQSMNVEETGKDETRRDETA